MGIETGEKVQSAWDRGKEWVLVSRIRVFGSAAAAAAVLMVFSLLIPSPAVSLFFTGLYAALTIILALLAGMTWWADRTGRTDGSDLWDAGPDDTAAPTELFEGFGFREDVDSPWSRGQ